MATLCISSFSAQSKQYKTSFGQVQPIKGTCQLVHSQEGMIIMTDVLIKSIVE